MVEKTVQYYLDEGTNNDFETLKRAFHETATMRYIADEYIKIISKRVGMKFAYKLKETKKC